MRRLALAALAASALVATAAIAQDAGTPPPAPPTEYSALASLRYPVVAGDITGRPYRVLGQITAEVRKATLFSSSPSQQHVYRELWERARRLHADAVINAQYGNARVTGLSWGSRRSHGEAIKFLTDAEIAAQAPQAPVVAQPQAPVEAQPQAQPQ